MKSYNMAVKFSDIGSLTTLKAKVLLVQIAAEGCEGKPASGSSLGSGRLADSVWGLLHLESVTSVSALISSGHPPVCVWFRIPHVVSVVPVWDQGHTIPVEAPLSVSNSTHYSVFQKW